MSINWLTVGFNLRSAESAERIGEESFPSSSEADWAKRPSSCFELDKRLYLNCVTVVSPSTHCGNHQCACARLHTRIESSPKNLLLDQTYTLLQSSRTKTRRRSQNSASISTAPELLWYLPLRGDHLGTHLSCLCRLLEESRRIGQPNVETWKGQQMFQAHPRLYGIKQD